MGFHAPHEQISPAQLLRDVQGAGSAWSKHAMCSDHFNPGSHARGYSGIRLGLAWCLAGAGLVTTDPTFGTVTAPGQRYHLVIIDKLTATPASMYPGRFWLAPGSAEHPNESITGEPVANVTTIWLGGIGFSSGPSDR